MSRITKAVLILLIHAVGSQFVLAQATAPATQPTTLPLEKLTLHPSPATRPASAHRLLPDAIDQTDGNAVTLYLQTRRFWPDQKTTDEVLYPENHKYDYQQTPIDQFPQKYAQRLLEAYSTTLLYADTGARRRDAIWDTGWREIGLGKPFSYHYLNDLRHVENLLAFRTQYQLWQRNWSGAEYTLQTSFAIARHLRTEPTLIHALVEAGFADIGSAVGVEAWVSGNGSPNLYWALTDLPSPFIELQPIKQWEWVALRSWKPRIFQALRGELPANEWEQAIRDMIAWRQEYRPPGKPDPATIEEEARRLTESALPRAREYLLAHGLRQGKLASMSHEQMVGTYLCQEYLAASDELWRYWAFPYPQAQEQMTRAWRTLAPFKEPASENPLIQAELISWIDNQPEAIPRTLRSRYQMTRTDRLIALMRVIEALRDYAAHHEGSPPQTLDQVTDLPVPLDPATGTPFRYELHGTIARLDAPPPPGRSIYSGFYFELTFAK